MSPPLAPSVFDTFASLLKTRSGLVIGPDKSYLLETRLGPMLRREKLPDLATLAARLRGPGAEALIREVVEAMTTNESFFFRDDKPFQHVRKEALPRLIAARPAGSTIRIWSAASSSGQEAYSLAMLIQEARASLGDRRVEIVGTDIAREQLARAQTGIYSQFEIQRGLPMQMLVQYFQKSPPNWQVNDTTRRMVQFREWNLLDNLRPLGQFDIVFCRNVLIYFDLPTKTRVLDAIARQMRPDAMLYLGGAETVMGVSNQFAPMASERGVYVRTPEASARPRAAVG